MKDEGLQAAKAAFQWEAECLADGFDYLNKDEFARAVDVLAGTQRIASCGCGHSGIACQHFAHLMCCMERPARFISPSEAVHGGLGFIQKGDVMLLASRGGKTEELIPVLQICRNKGAFVIVVTENQTSYMAAHADIVLALHVNREADKYNSQGTTSFTAMCVIFDALQSALIEETGFENEQFARIHPGGAVGQRLNN